MVSNIRSIGGTAMIYVMADIHGQYGAFTRMLDKIKFSKGDKLYIIGDVIDRGDSVSVLKEIWSRDNIEVLRGNHEDMARESVRKGYVTNVWAHNGGRDTYNQLESAGLMDQFKDWVYSLGDFKVLEDKKILLIHAGLKYGTMNSDNLEDAIKEEGDGIYWLRPSSLKDKMFNEQTYGYTVICGHTPTFKLESKDSAEILKINNGYIIDCGACYPFYGGRLSCLRLDDFKVFYEDADWE